MKDQRYDAFRAALQRHAVVSLSEERIIDGQTAMGMLSHLQEQQPFYALERFGAGASLMALDPYLTMTCDARHTRIMCGGQDQIGPAMTPWEGLARLQERFGQHGHGESKQHPAAGVLGMLDAQGTARWMVPQAVVVLHPDKRDRVTVVRHVFAEAVTHDDRAAYDHAVRQLRRLVTWICAPTYVKPLSVHAPMLPMHADEVGQATPLHIYRYLRQVMPAQAACFVREEGFHLLGADLQAVLTRPADVQAALQGAAQTPTSSAATLAVCHAAFDGTFQGLMPAGALRIVDAAAGPRATRTLPEGCAAAPYREALLLADGDAL